jgi:hypothetical protein
VPKRTTVALAWGVAGWAALTIAFATTVAPATTGCATHQCDPSHFTWTTGDWIDENTWETSDINGRWMRYDGNATVTIQWSSHPDGRVPYWVDASIGLEEDGGDNPNGGGDDDGGSNFVPGAGSVVEFLTYGTSKENHVIVLNNTCADYLARFVIHFPPRESDAAASSD